MSPPVYLDATWVGLPVVVLLREQVRSGEVVAVWFTYGDRRTETRKRDHRRVSVGNSDMVSRVQVLPGRGRLHLPRTREAAALTEELLDFELRVNQNGHETSGAFKTGVHDDLVSAVGLATQVDFD